MFKHTIAVAATVFGLIAAAPLHADAVPLKPGLWAVKVLRSVGANQTAPLNTETCLTAADLKEYRDLKHFLIAGTTGGAENCEISDYQKSGAKVTYAAICKEGPERVRVRAEATVAPESYHFVTHADYGEMALRIEYVGKRVGNCS